MVSVFSHGYQETRTSLVKLTTRKCRDREGLSWVRRNRQWDLPRGCYPGAHASLPKENPALQSWELKNAQAGTWPPVRPSAPRSGNILRGGGASVMDKSFPPPPCAGSEAGGFPCARCSLGLPLGPDLPGAGGPLTNPGAPATPMRPRTSDFFLRPDSCRPREVQADHRADLQAFSTPYPPPPRRP